MAETGLTMSVMELASTLGVSRSMAYTLTRRDDFPVLRLGRRKLILRDGLNEWLRKNANWSEEYHHGAE